ncbi:hypothetical protein SERLA73DRAFT_182338 [Serpula lacrymans var. lacrymans S7.3]|uniref:methylated diphthine methylhydrolase n=1 Tax=Serpula lacrymans var. lacrymans (strain S7.3) TaxID=936435 RepID=F8PXA4_SERL3|nr:hypothetical protein SERLA73DRAFT_182338 [Serpula lacrymans var. lacrymans S7.3]
MAPFDTVYPADSIEFCPNDDARDIFVCGTYKLEQPEPDPSAILKSTEEVLESNDVEQVKRKQIRRGKCLVFEVISRDGKEFQQIQEFSLPAVLDMKWCHRPAGASPLLGIADAEGNITLHEWRADERRLSQTVRIPCVPDAEDVLCLSLDWSNRRYATTSDISSLVVSLSNGSLCILRPAESTMAMSDSWHAHDYEPWIAAWDYWNTNVIYSGGDDLKMKGWDVRQGFDRPTFVNKRFDAGITTIQSHPHVEHLVAVGSYDNTVRLFDVRKPLVPVVEADVGGGAWRVKWHPSPRRKDDLLVACMHDGFKIVRFSMDLVGIVKEEEFVKGGEGWEVVKRFDEHESLAYGVDWCFDDAAVGRGNESGESESLIASCSFYDHVLHLWSG